MDGRGWYRGAASGEIMGGTMERSSSRDRAMAALHPAMPRSHAARIN
jgi:hypothetical protein